MKYLLLLITTLTLAFAQKPTLHQLFSVQTVKVKEISEAKKFKSFGFVKIDESKIYDIAPRYSGYVEVLNADTIYKKVKRGEVLATVYSPEVLKAKNDYLSTINYTKNRPNKLMLQSSIDKLKLLDVPNYEITLVKKQRKSSNYTNIVSPVDGFVFEKNIHSGSAFKQMQKIFTIVNLDTLWVEVKIHQNQLQALQNSTTFTLTTPAYQQKFSAKKVLLYPKLDEKEEAFTLRLEVQNREHLLLPNMYMNVSISAHVQKYLTLPSTAVIRKNGKFYVFVVTAFKGEYEPKEIEVEVLNPDTYIIKNGLNSGDEVVNNALFMMDSDAQINGLY